MPALLFCVWWLMENILVHLLAFNFLLCTVRVDGRHHLLLWLSVDGIATLAAISFRLPAAFLFSVLLLAVFARIVLQIPAPDLIVTITVIATLYTLKEGISALILSWLSVSFRSPTGGILEQLLVPLLLDAVLLMTLHIAQRRYFQIQWTAKQAHLYILLPPCAFAVLAIRCGLRLDCSDFEPYLAAFGVGVRFSAFCLIIGLAIVVSVAFAAFCGLTRLSDRERFLCGQLAVAEQRNMRCTAFQHDIDNHLLVLSGLLRERSFTQAEQFADQLRAGSDQLCTDISTGNLALDVLLKEKLAAAQDGHIAVTCDVNIPQGFGAKDMDLCTLFANIFDNATAACLNEPPKERFFFLSARVKSQLLVVDAVNSASGSGSIVFGTGLTNVRRIAEDYHGTMETELSRGRFRISVLLCSR